MTAGWGELPLGEACDLIVRGIAPAYTDEGQVRVVNQKCVREHRVDYSLTRRNDTDLKRVSAERFIRRGDVLVNSTGQGTLGRVAQVRDEPDEPTTVDTHVTIVRPRRSLFKLEYFGYALVQLEDHLAAAGEGASGQTELARSKIAEFTIPIPPLAEQERIVAGLDEAFEAIVKATTNTEAVLDRARALYHASTSALLQRRGPDWSEVALGDLCEIARGGSPRPIHAFLTDSDDGVNWIKIGDASASGRTILRTEQKIRPEGVSRSRKVYAGDLLLTNSMSFGRPYILGTDGCIHDGWLVLGANPTCYDQTFLYHLLGSEAVYSQFDRLAAGSTVRNLNIDLVSRVVVQLPPLVQQQHIARKIDRLEREVVEFKGQLTRKLALLAELKAALLTRAFSGELTTGTPANDNAFATPEQVANVIAFAQRRHEARGRQQTYGRVKAQKNLHFVESVGGVYLDRRPQKDAAGPNDFPHMLTAERWARSQGFFEFIQNGQGYSFRKLANYKRCIVAADVALASIRDRLEISTDLIVDLDSRGAEVLATVHAAWNNLVLDGVEATDDAIVREARDDWHPAKLKIPASEFHRAIRSIRRLGIVPDGSARRVGQARLL